MGKKFKCPFCKADFDKHHGNQVYCSQECKRHQKAATQYKLYGILKEFRNGFLVNYKLFENLVPDSGSKKITLWQLNGMGFKPNCYYGIFVNEKKETFYRIGGYSYQVINENQIQYIKIIKR